MLERHMHASSRDLQDLYVVIRYLYKICIIKVCFGEVLLKKCHMKLLIKLHKAAILLTSWFGSFMCNRESVLEVVIFCNLKLFKIWGQKDYFICHPYSCGRCLF